MHTQRERTKSTQQDVHSQGLNHNLPPVGDSANRYTTVQPQKSN